MDSRTLERRLMLYAAAVLKKFRKFEVSEIALIWCGYNVADGVTKCMSQSTLRKAVFDKFFLSIQCKGKKAQIAILLFWYITMMYFFLLFWLTSSIHFTNF